MSREGVRRGNGKGRRAAWASDSVAGQAMHRVVWGSGVKVP